MTIEIVPRRNKSKLRLPPSRTGGSNGIASIRWWLALLSLLALLVSNGLQTASFFLPVQQFMLSQTQGLEGAIWPDFNDHNTNIDGEATNTRSNNSSILLCLVTKDPHQRYIDEWADYHFALGFTHLQLFDNSENYTLKNWGQDKWYHDRILSSTHFIPGVTHEIIDKGDATNFLDFVYQACIQTALTENISWVATIDYDEFLVFADADKWMKRGILEFMERYCPVATSSCGQLSLNWVIFQHDGRKKYAPVPMTRRFQYRGSQAESWVKPIVDPLAVDPSIPWRHTFGLKADREWWDTSGRVLRTAGKRWNYMHNHHRPMDVASLYHYSSKSAEEFFYKQCRRGTLMNDGPADCQAKLPDMPDDPVFDDSAWQMLIRLAPEYERKHGNVTDLG